MYARTYVRTYARTHARTLLHPPFSPTAQHVTSHCSIKKLHGQSDDVPILLGLGVDESDSSRFHHMVVADTVEVFVRAAMVHVNMDHLSGVHVNWLYPGQSVQARSDLFKTKAPAIRLRTCADPGGCAKTVQQAVLASALFGRISTHLSQNYFERVL